MKIKELTIAAAVAALVMPATLHATSDEGGGGATSGMSSSSDSGYSVEESTPSTSSNLPTENGNIEQNGDQGGAGATSGDATTGSSSDSSTSEDAGGAGSTSGSVDEGGSGTTTGAAGSSGSILASQIKGVVDSVDAARRSVTIRDSQGNLTSYKLEKNAKVQIGSRNSSLASLTNGDQVTITVSDSDPTAAKSIKVSKG